MALAQTAMKMMVNVVNKNLIKPLVFTRKISRSSVAYESRALQVLKSKQAKFQCNDGLPIWLKGGACDKILYMTTLIACAVGIVGVLVTIYDHAKPNTWKNDPPAC